MSMKRQNAHGLIKEHQPTRRRLERHTHTHRTNDICHFWMCAQAQNDGSNDFFPKKKMLSIFRIDVDVDEFFFWLPLTRAVRC